MLAGCLSPRMSRTVRSTSLVSVLILSSRFMTPLVLFVEMRLKAACTLPFFIFWANLRDSVGSFLDEWIELKRCWMHVPSLSRASRSTASNRSSLLRRCLAWSLALEFFDGFWSSNCCKIVTPFMAIHSRLELSA